MKKNKEVLKALQRTTVGVLAALDNKSNKIKQRIMYYGIDSKFNIYFMSSKNSSKMNQMSISPEVSFIVFGLEEPYDNTWEIDIEGRVRIVEELKEQEIILNNLKNRNPFANVAIESNIINHFNFFHLIPEVIKYSIYGEILKGNSPVIIKL
jgi:general stress protein 26